MIFIFEWMIFYCCIMIAMCIDNIFWIPADREWYVTGKLRPHFYVWLVFRDREYLFPKTKWAWKFIFTNRIKSVLTHQYDIVPALISSGILTIIF